MKMVKSFLLGSAAGLVAVAGAQAADLPVKAKPVEYVKVCSLYGAGYYYMPGTDICIKLGGYVRYQFTFNPGASITCRSVRGRRRPHHPGRLARDCAPHPCADHGRHPPADRLRHAAHLHPAGLFAGLDGRRKARLRPVYMTRGFLQIAGFTFGKATSFFDIVPGASFAYNAGMFHHPDTGDAGKMLAAYTAQFGNGLSGTIALEQARVRGIARVGLAAPMPSGHQPGRALQRRRHLAGVSEYPDLVGNIRLDQSWGTWLVGAAAPHSTVASTTALGTPATRGGPDGQVGWAVTTGFIWNLPMIAPGDRLSAGIVYSQGAIGYASVTPSGAPLNKFEGTAFGYGFWTPSRRRL